MVPPFLFEDLLSCPEIAKFSLNILKSISCFLLPSPWKVMLLCLRQGSECSSLCVCGQLSWPCTLHFDPCFWWAVLALMVIPMSVLCSVGPSLARHHTNNYKLPSKGSPQIGLMLHWLFFA